MASLIGWLADVGARDATGAPVASGYAWFFQPGTTSSTQEVVFSDADGLYALTQPVALDAGGRATVFTNTIVQVLVQTATGADVISHDRGNAVTADQVEIEQEIATGTDLDTGAQVQGGRTTLGAYLSSVLTSFGAPDGYVLVGTGPRLLKDVLGESSSLFFTITNTAYAGGAVGDGSTDDTSAIQAAIDAASTAGGGIVYVPPGTYKLTRFLSITTNRIRILGIDPGVCKFKTYDSGVVGTNYCMIASGDDLVVDGITFDASGASNARALKLDGANARIVSCNFNSAVGPNAAVRVTGRADFVSCNFTINSTSQSTISASGQVRILGGRLVTTVNSPAAALATDGTTNFITVVGAELTHGGTGTWTVAAAASGSVLFTGCFSLAGTVVLGQSTAAREAGCMLVASTFTAGVGVASTTRDQMVATSSGSATSYLPDISSYGVFDITSTGASFAWTNPAVAAFTGQRIVLRYTNTSGGAITPSFGTTYKMSAVSVANNSACAWLLVYNGTNFFQVGAPVAYTA